jgi:septal ring factor EnvC (AmiA/AmiB activator)
MKNLFKLTVLTIGLMTACATVALADGNAFTPLNFAGDKPAASTKPATVTNATGNTEFQNAILQLDNAQVSVRNELLNYKSKYADVDAQYQSVKAQRKALSEQIKACEKRIRQIDKQKESIKKNII